MEFRFVSGELQKAEIDLKKDNRLVVHVTIVVKGGHGDTSVDGSIDVDHGESLGS